MTDPNARSMRITERGGVGDVHQQIASLHHRIYHDQMVDGLAVIDRALAVLVEDGTAQPGIWHGDVWIGWS